MDVVKMLAHFQLWLTENGDDYRLASTVDEIYQAKQENKLAIMFNIEGGCALDERLSLIQFYHDLGVGIGGFWPINFRSKKLSTYLKEVSNPSPIVFKNP